MATHEAENILSQATLAKMFSTNTFAPLLLTQALLHCLLKFRSLIIGLMSSRLSSIANKTSGGSYAYRASKAALNSIRKSMACGLRDRGVVVVLMHPGYVKTGLDTSGYTHQMAEAVEPDKPAEKLWRMCAVKKIDEMVEPGQGKYRSFRDNEGNLQEWSRFRKVRDKREIQIFEFPWLVRFENTH